MRSSLARRHHLAGDRAIRPVREDDVEDGLLRLVEDVARLGRIVRHRDRRTRQRRAEDHDAAGRPGRQQPELVRVGEVHAHAQVARELQIHRLDLAHVARAVERHADGVQISLAAAGEFHGDAAQHVRLLRLAVLDAEIAEADRRSGHGVLPLARKGQQMDRVELVARKAQRMASVGAEPLAVQVLLDAHDLLEPAHRAGHVQEVAAEHERHVGHRHRRAGEIRLRREGDSRLDPAGDRLPVRRLVQIQRQPGGRGSALHRRQKRGADRQVMQMPVTEFHALIISCRCVFHVSHSGFGVPGRLNAR